MTAPHDSRPSPGGPRRRARPAARGRQADAAALDEIAALLGPRPRRRDLLIEHLHLIQDRYRHISARHLCALAELMRLPMAEAYEVATFYHHFDVVGEGETPPAAIALRVCESLPCRLAGCEALIAALAGRLGPEVRIVRAPCMGRCEQAPAAKAGMNDIGHASAEGVAAAIAAGELEARAPDYRDFNAYSAAGGYRQLRRVLAGELSRERLIQTMEDSSLRGLGGAGFPAGRKWRFVLMEPAPRLMAVNADEGEVGTFKDRHYLERDPHRFLEGMLIAAWAVEAREVYIYLRDEYPALRAVLEAEIAHLAHLAPLGAPAAIHLRRGAGAYICGEESAMIESIEGKRGLPRHRPPFVAKVGLFGRPTLVHNVETLYWVPEILERGAAWFTGHGRHGRQGLRSFSVSGRVKRPGVKLAPAGITARELIDEHCGGMQDGHRFKAYLPGGASGGILPASLGDVPLDFDTIQPHGGFIGSAAVIVLSHQDSAADAALSLMKFFEDESCGQCTPCRAGCEKAARLMAGPWNGPLLEELSRTMVDASICGLGQAAPNPVLTALKYFPEDVS